MPKQSYKNQKNQQNVYIGIDVHLKQWNVCIIQGGITRKPFQQDASAECLLRHLNKNYPEMNYFSAYEAGICGCSIHYRLEDLGIKNIIFNAADVSQTHKEKVRKTDAIDAKKIARSLADGELSCIHIPPLWRLADRNLLRLRSSYISDIMRQKCRIRHFLHTNGIRIPLEYSHSNWPKVFFNWMQSVGTSLGDSTGQTLLLMIEKLNVLLESLKRLNRDLVELMNTERYIDDYKLLQSIPGVGTTTAMTILLECGNLDDFKSADAFCAFVGLIPDTNISDEHEKQCGITQRRHRVLRYMLTECAWRAIRKDDYFSSLYAKYCRKMPKNKSIVKVAKKLAKIIKFVLKNKERYEPQT